jgi:hypothetical protein
MVRRIIPKRLLIIFLKKEIFRVILTKLNGTSQDLIETIHFKNV